MTSTHLLVEAGMARKSIRFAQNFLKSRRLAATIVREAHIGHEDLVYEIGAGRGVITAELAKAAGRVVAVEIDRSLASRLERLFADAPQVSVRCGDFLRQPLPRCDYKVIGSIPYNCTARIVRALFCTDRTPVSAHLVVQMEAARRFAGLPHDTLWSAFLKPWHDVEVAFLLRRNDFDPPPGVNSALLKIVRRDPPMLNAKQAARYRFLVRAGFCGGKPNAYKNLEYLFTYRQWKRLARDLGFDLRATPTQLRIEHWVGLFRFIEDGQCASRFECRDMP